LGRDEAESRDRRRVHFAERNERFRGVARKPLKSLGMRNGHFAEFTIFNDFNPHFVSRQRRRSRRSELQAELSLLSEKQYRTPACLGKELSVICQAPLALASNSSAFILRDTAPAHLRAIS
jgi:hypothetical protein